MLLTYDHFDGKFPQSSGHAFKYGCVVSVRRTLKKRHAVGNNDEVVVVKCFWVIVPLLYLNARSHAC